MPVRVMEAGFPKNLWLEVKDPCGVSDAYYGLRRYIYLSETVNRFPLLYSVFFFSQSLEVPHILEISTLLANQAESMG